MARCKIEVKLAGDAASILTGTTHVITPVTNDGFIMKRGISILSHTIVAGAGWALVMIARHPLPQPAVQSTGATTEARRVPTKTHVRESWQGDGGRLLRELLEKREKLEDFGDIPPAADRAAAARLAMAAFRENPADLTLLREASARLAHWLEVDPKAALAFWDSSAGFNSWPDSPISAVLTLAAKNADLATLLTYLSPPGTFYLGCGESRNKVLLPLLVKSIAATGSTSQLESALEAFYPYGSMLLYQTIPAWPENRLDALAPSLAGISDPNLLDSYLERLPASQQRAWLQDRFASDVTADPAQAALLRNLLNRANALPLQERIEWMTRLDQASGKAWAGTPTPEYLVKEDVSNFLNRMNWNQDGLLGDWRFRLQHGQLTPAEILAEVRQVLPDAAASEPDLLLRSVFQNLAQYAPEGAVKLLDGLPVEEREKLVLESASSFGRFNNPQALFDLVSTLPPHSGSNGDERFEVWMQAANPDDDRLGDSYGAWVMALPPGVERDMALSALASRFDLPDPQAAAVYRAARTQPDGSMPGQK